MFFFSFISNRYRREYMLASTSLDIGIKPAAGLRPRKLRTEDAIEEKIKGNSDGSPKTGFYNRLQKSKSIYD